MDNLKSKRIFISPYSPISRRLERYLIRNYSIEFLGYIDKSKVGSQIYKKDILTKEPFDFIVIFSPNHHKSIYKELLKEVSKQKLMKIDFLNNEYFILNEKLNLQKFNNFKRVLLKTINKIVDILKIKRDINLFIAEDYIDSNIKHLYLYYLKKGKKVLLLTNNKKQIEELRKNSLPVEELFSLKGFIKTAFSNRVFLDHFILNYLEYCSKKQLKIQLWHGVGLKPIRDRSFFEYDYFVSTSNWTNDTNFKRVFKAKEFVNFGYSRNDVLLKQDLDRYDLIFCDINIYNQILKDKKSGFKIVLYMPTFRENGFDSFPLNFDIFNEELKSIKAKFYIKLHPYVLNQYLDSLDNEKDYSNIVFYNTQGDIYPILRQIDVLVTDYSSIAYDFLFLNRPTIFFIYDYEEYIKVREDGIGDKFLFNFYEYTAGDKVKTQEELLKSILKNINIDEYREKREELRDKFYDFVDSTSCKRLDNLLTNN